MSKLVSAYAYKLPPGRIAQRPAAPRESAKLMVVDRAKDALRHAHVRDLPEFLDAGDVVVVNVSKVFNARLKGTFETGGAAELFLIRPANRQWLAIGKPGKKLRPGAVVVIARNFKAKVVKNHGDGTLTVDFGLPDDEVIRLANRHGEIPIPPYIKKLPKRGEYQTVYARREGSVAAPTAGFHLTQPLIDGLKKKGVIFAEVVLHVGLGTFQPIRTKKLEEHRMHAEWVEIPRETVGEILKAKIERRRVIAVGTTTVRALEGAVERCRRLPAGRQGELCAWHGDVELFIAPGFEFQVVDALLTNFHLPKSTLLVLVSAFAGRKKILQAYEQAVKKKYRFYSFGDAMLII